MTQAPANAGHAGLILVPKDLADLTALVQDLHAAGISAGAVSVFGHPDPAAAKVLAAAGDPPLSPEQDAPTHVLRALAPDHRNEAFGMTLGAALGLLGGVGVMLMPGFAPLVLAGGGPAFAAVEALTVALGVGTGAAIGGVVSATELERHQHFFEKTLAAGRWLVVVRGTHDQLERAKVALPRFHELHVEAL